MSLAAELGSALLSLDFRRICRVIPYFIEQLLRPQTVCLPRIQVLKTKDLLPFIFGQQISQMGSKHLTVPPPHPRPQPLSVARLTGVPTYLGSGDRHWHFSMDRVECEGMGGAGQQAVPASWKWRGKCSFGGRREVSSPP